jgi:hypothetical protein
MARMKPGPVTRNRGSFTWMRPVKPCRAFSTRRKPDVDGGINEVERFPDFSPNCGKPLIPFY